MHQQQNLHWKGNTDRFIKDTPNWSALIYIPVGKRKAQRDLMIKQLLEVCVGVLNKSNK